MFILYQYAKKTEQFLQKKALLEVDIKQAENLEQE